MYLFIDFRKSFVKGIKVEIEKKRQIPFSSLPRFVYLYFIDWWFYTIFIFERPHYTPRDRNVFNSFPNVLLFLTRDILSYNRHLNNILYYTMRSCYCYQHSAARGIKNNPFQTVNVRTETKKTTTTHAATADECVQRKERDWFCAYALLYKLKAFVSAFAPLQHRQLWRTVSNNFHAESRQCWMANGALVFPDIK